ncbi:MAG: GAF domain-containing sensor histidine kinase, partial [Ktedonobacterales bacterium]
LERRTHKALAALLKMAEALVSPDVPVASDAHAGEFPVVAANPAAQRLVALTRRVLQCDLAAIVGFDSETLRLTPLAVDGIVPEHEAQWWVDLTRTPLSGFFEPDVVQRLRLGETVLVDLEERPLLNQAEANYGARRILIVPMRVGERIVGLLAIEHRDERRVYTDDEVTLVDAVANLAALVVERERLLREREEARANEIALREANRRMDEFLGIASHELKTPLTTIKANVQLLARQMAGEAARKKAGSTRGGAEAGGRSQMRRTMLERTDRQVDRLTRLVNDLVDVSRIREGKLELRPERFDLARAVGDAVVDQQQARAERAISLDSPETPVMVTADADRIGQVVTNYLTNALKYSTDEKSVRVTVRVDGNVARVEVRDEGPGLPPEEHERVWERFHRAAGILEQSGSGVGLGLGLHISKTIVERHDGQVGVASAPGDGSTFWFTLPLEPRSPTEV